MNAATHADFGELAVLRHQAFQPVRLVDEASGLKPADDVTRRPLFALLRFIGWIGWHFRKIESVHDVLFVAEKIAPEFEHQLERVTGRKSRKNAASRPARAEDEDRDVVLAVTKIRYATELLRSTVEEAKGEPVSVEDFLADARIPPIVRRIIHSMEFIGPLFVTLIILRALSSTFDLLGWRSFSSQSDLVHQALHQVLDEVIAYALARGGSAPLPASIDPVQPLDLEKIAEDWQRVRRLRSA